MSSWLGLGGSQTSKPIIYSGLQVSSSQMDMPLTLFWGQRRMGTDALWYNGFKKHAVSAKGKGGGAKGGQQYTYSADCILALGEGVIDSIVNVWSQGSTTTTTSLAALNMTFFQGTAVQSPWSYVVTKFPTQARAYALTSYLGAPQLDLGSSATVPDYGFECVRSNSFAYTHTSDGWENPTTHVVTSAIDCLMSDIIPDMLTNPQYGMNWVSGDIGDTTQYGLYQRAQGLFFSPLLKTQEKATSVIDRWAQLSNAWIYWSGTQLQFVPLGDSEVTGNGVTYTPDNDAAYNLVLSDFLDQSSPVKVSRVDPADCYNRTVLQITDRTLGYISNPLEYKDQTLIDQFGLRDDSSTQADEVCDPAVGTIIVQLLGKRAAYLRNSYAFKTSYRFVRCLPGTVLTLTEPNIGLDRLRVRVRTVEEDENGVLSFLCEEFPGTIGTYTTANQTTGFNLPTTPDQNVLPGSVNTPAIVEPNSAFTGGKAILLVSASWGVNGGRAQVNISFDGTDYQEIGWINSPAVQGLLTAGLASHADPDTVNTLAVDCTESLSTPQPVTHADADALRTLSMVAAQPVLSSGSYVMPTNGELLAFGDVATTGTYSANLTYLRRGQYGTSPTAHIAGDQFTVVDVLGSSGTSLSYELPPQYIGQPVWIKLCLENAFGNNLQDLSSALAYKYTPTGSGYGGGIGGVPTTPTGIAVSPLSGQNLVSWNSNPATDNVIHYTVYRGNGTGTVFGSCSPKWSGLATSWMDTSVVSGQAYTYYVVATNAVGDSLPDGPANTTSTTVTYPFRAVGGTPGRLPLDAEELFVAIMRTGDSLPSTLPNSFIACEVAPTSNWTLTLYKNGVSIGTGTILAGHTTGTWTFSSTVSFTDGDLWKGTAMTPQDATLSGISYSIAGTRTQ